MDGIRFINARIGRWLFPILLLAAGFTRHGGGLWHVGFGTAFTVVAGLRIMEGFIGRSDVRFETILHGTRGRLLTAVLAFCVLTSLAGILLTLGSLWSARWLQGLHAVSALLLFVSAAIYGSIYYLARPKKGGI